MGSHHSIPVPTLEIVALFKVLIPLWNHYDQKLIKIKSEICEGEINREEYATWSRKELQAVGMKIRESIYKLELPKSLQDRLVYFMDLIGMQINAFKNFFYWNCEEPPKTCLEFVWTVHGTVEKTETAKKIVQDESRDLKLRYKLSCFFCFEEEILKLWNLFENEAKKEFWNSKYQLIKFWSHLTEIKNKNYQYKLEHNRGPYECALRMSLKTNNEAGVKYFLNLLNPEKRDSILLKIAVYEVPPGIWCSLYFPPEYYGDVYFFLYSKMKEQYRIEALRLIPDDIATVFWFWPYKIYCVDFFNMLIQRHSSIPEFHLMIEDALYYCRPAFEDFWRSCSIAVKKGFIISRFCKENTDDYGLIIETLAEYQNVTVFKDIVSVVNEVWLSKIYTYVVNLKGFDVTKEKIIDEYYLLVKEKMEDCDIKMC